MSQTTYRNPDFAITLTEAGGESTYRVHDRLPFNELGEEIASGSSALEACKKADKVLGWTSVQS